MRRLVTWLVLVAVGVLITSFMPGEEARTTKGVFDEQCSSGGRRKVVFVVVDALRLTFVTNRTVMKFTNSEIRQNHVALFDATARMPTVTLPRITAFLTGTLSQFGTVLTNLASNEMIKDSWVKAAKESGKRMRFYGDDTWLKLYPDSFEDSVGVPSFFVNDYTEVDETVLRGWRRSLTEQDQWDVLILHFLGLDHIGHSLGGTSEEIDKKLRMFDDFLNETVSQLQGEWMLMAVGDHGMTEAGSHGGASYEESHVPILIWNQKKVREGVEPAEQMDVAATVSSFLRLRQPSDSYGISRIGSLGFDEADVYNDLINMKAHFEHEKSEPNCNNLTQKIRQLRREHLPKWELIQRELIQKSSGFSKGSLLISILMLGAAFWIQANTVKKSKNMLLVFLPLVSLFSSSSVEEEHEIWYFLTATALLVEFWRRRDWRIVTCAILHRLGTEWKSGSRRRWSMDRSLLPPEIFPETLVNVDWTAFNGLKIIALGFLLLSPFLVRSRKDVIGVLSLAAAFFRGSFWAANVVRLGLLLNTRITLLAAVVLVTPQMNLWLLLGIILMAKTMKDPFLAMLLVNSAFFYQGNSNSLSTLDLSSAYTAVTEYNPVVVGAQLLMNTYSGPIIFLAFLEQRTETIKLLLTYRLISLIVSIVSFLHFSDHLFVWSVFAPKVIYELSHCLLATLAAASVSLFGERE